MYAPSDPAESHTSQAPLKHSWAGGVSLKVMDVLIENMGDYHYTDQSTATLGVRHTIEHRRFTIADVEDDFSGNPQQELGFVHAEVRDPAQIHAGCVRLCERIEGLPGRPYNNRAVSLASALPYNDYQNLQLTATIISPVIDTPVSVGTTTASAHTEGCEAETVVEPVNGLQLTQ